MKKYPIYAIYSRNKYPILLLLTTIVCIILLYVCYDWLKRVQEIEQIKKETIISNIAEPYFIEDLHLCTFKTPIFYIFF